MSTLAVFVRKPILLLRRSVIIKSEQSATKTTFCSIYDRRRVRLLGGFRGFRGPVARPTAVGPVQVKRRWLCSRSSGSDSSDQNADAETQTLVNGLGRVGVAGLVSPSAMEGTDAHIIKMHSWPFQLPSPFGKLLIDQTSFPVRIVPANVHDFPAGDRVFVHLLANVPKGLSAQFELASSQKIISNIRCSQDGSNVILSHEQVDDTTPLLWLIEVPTCYDIDVSSKAEGHISIESLENEECCVRTENGNIALRSLKSAHVKVHSDGGHIRCIKALQGSGLLETKRRGMVNADKLQGLDFTVLTESGPIHIKDIYARKSKVCSQTGPITISNMHTDCRISTRANVDTGSVEGYMSAILSGAGEFRGFLSRPDSVEIKTESGNIYIRLPEDCRSKVNLVGKSVEIDNSLVFFSTEPSDSQKKIGDLNGGGESTITASSEGGQINVKTLSWFDSLGLSR